MTEQRTQGLLLIFKGEEEVSIPVDKKDFFIGRSFETDLWFTDDPKVSRKHCRIYRLRDNFYIEDLKSSNGTFVNRVKISEPTEIHTKDIIQIGSRKITFLTDRRTVKIDLPPELRQVTCKQCGAIIKFPKGNRDTIQHSDRGYLCPECSPSDKLLHTVIGNFEILEKIAQGGMGIVYKAKHRIIDSVVALKVMRVALQEDEDAVKRFMREVKLGSRITHPNIVKFLDADEEDGSSYLVMEFIEGVPLEKQLDEGKIYSTISPEFAEQIFGAVETIHNAGMIHRDIKPSNIIVSMNNVVKLIDLGLIKNISAQSLSILTNSGIGLGTPHYLPPEQLLNAATVDKRADIYSLGATFYHMICGVTPITGRTKKEFYKKIQECNITHPCDVNKHIPKKVGNWVMKALSREPKDRYKNIKEFRKAYNKINK
jgi:hypothetical protein